MSIVYLNGEYKEQQNAKVSVFDRGFNFGDGIYEVVPVYENNTLLGFDAHYERLQKSLNAVHINCKLSKEQLREIINHLIQANTATNCCCYLQITRGEDDTRSHNIKDDLEPTVFACLLPFHRYSPKENYSMRTSEDIRWQWCNIKAITLLPNIVLLNQAKAAGVDDVLLVRGSNITEGASSNVFMVKNNVIATPPKDNHILGGITRDFIIEIAHKHKIKIDERPISKDELMSADEIWVTGSTKEVQAVTKIDDQVISNGQAGPVTLKMHDLFKQEVALITEAK